MQVLKNLRNLSTLDSLRGRLEAVLDVPKIVVILIAYKEENNNEEITWFLGNALQKTNQEG